jgi:two-component system, OmpR family, response regulator CpxR
MANILVMDDERNLCEPLIESMIHEGFQVDLAHDRDTLIRMARRNEYSLIILDVSLPEGNNDFSALQHIRSRTITPLFALTSGSDEGDRILGLEMGADDCLQKPINPRELLARIRAVLRRLRLEGGGGTPPQLPERMRVGDVEMDVGTRVVLRSGKRIPLTSVEFSILEVLLSNAGKLVSRAELTPVALGRSFFSHDRSIDVHVSKLRKKLGHEVSGMERIKTIRGEGYLYALTRSPGADSGF